ncbi:MAG TPA: hypothetical protein VF657_11420 [Actinoplanes sp.]|jgi:hypothetical protein
MDLEITTPENADGDDLAELRDWLADDAAMRGVPVSMRRTRRQSGEMAGGGLADMLVTMVDDRTAIIAVSTAVAGWLTARASSRRTRIKVRHGDREMEIDSSKVRDPEQLARRMRDELLADDAQVDHPRNAPAPNPPEE